MLKMNGIIIKKIIHVVLLVDSLVSYSCPDPAKIKHTFLWDLTKQWRDYLGWEIAEIIQ